MRSEKEIRDMLEAVHDEMIILNENPPLELGEYTVKMDMLEYMRDTLKWVLGESKNLDFIPY